MKRDIVRIDEDLCNGCGLCIPNCHEGALQIIDGKARLVSDLMCDGLGACLGHCPENAITIEKREARQYNETEVVKDILKKGKNVLIAHLKHLEEHGEVNYLNEAMSFLKNAEINGFTYTEILNDMKKEQNDNHEGHCGCQGSKPQSFNVDVERLANQKINVQSQLTHWPVQLHLINPQSSYFEKSDLLVAADCVAYTLGNFHSDYLRGKKLVIACPKLDSGLEIYLEKIKSLIDDAGVNTITVMMMEVPCCSGLLKLVKQAVSETQRKVPVKSVVVGIKGEILSEDWV